MLIQTAFKESNQNGVVSRPLVSLWINETDECPINADSMVSWTFNPDPTRPRDRFEFTHGHYHCCEC